MNKDNIFKITISIIVCELAGIVGSIFTVSSVRDWYTALNKPGFIPPSWLFAPVWIILFLLMGISLYLVWSKNFAIKNILTFSKGKAWNPLSEKLATGKWQKINIILIFWLQLILNILWSVTFFNFRQPGLAFFELLMLWFAILYTIVNFYRISKPASYLLVVYIIWVTFAGFLNYSLWMLNL